MTALSDLVASELAEPVDRRVSAFAADIAAHHAKAAIAVLFYGSCLRSSELDGEMLDFYLIVSDYRAAYDRKWLAVANRLIPPNVFPAGYEGLQAKYAVLSESDFVRLASSRTRNVSVWARFAQPSRLVWVQDDRARDAVVRAVSLAAPALLAAARPLQPSTMDPLDRWRDAFARTYGAELRAERQSRPGAVVDAQPFRYLQFTDPVLAQLPAEATESVAVSRRRWLRRRVEGKLLTLVRLAKATATYAGGIDYIAWKINRHADTQISVKPWQRRFPLLGALVMLPRLIVSGAIK